MRSRSDGRRTGGSDMQRDLTRTVLAVLLMVVLIGASFWVLRPFLLAIVWAAMIVVATWPMMLKLQHAIRSRALAVTIMSGAMVLVFVVPLVLAIQALVDNADTIKGLDSKHWRPPRFPRPRNGSPAFPWSARRSPGVGQT